MSDLEARVARLEHAVKTWKTIAVALTAVGIVAACVNKAPSSAAPNEVRLLHPNGKAGAVLTPTSLTMYDTKGTQVAMIGAGPVISVTHGERTAQLRADSMSARIEARDESKTGARIEIGKDKSSFETYTEAGNVELSTTSSQSSVRVQHGEKVVGSIKAAKDPNLALVQAQNGKVGVELMVADDFSDARLTKHADPKRVSLRETVKP